MATAAAPQTNGVLPASSASVGTNSQTLTLTQQSASQPPGGVAAAAAGAAGAAGSNNAGGTGGPGQQQPLASPTAATPQPRPRDVRTLELLLTAQGVTAYEARVPLLLLDFAYRHTAAVLADALHLSGDPYTAQAGARPTASSGAVASAGGAGGDATVSPNAVLLAVASRQALHAGAAVAKDWLLEMARERNRTALPRIAPADWGVRLPSERFVLSGTAWGLRETWAGEEGEDEDEDGEEDDGRADGGKDAGPGGEAMEGVEATATADEGGDPVEGGTLDDVFGPDIEDEEMAEE